MPGRAVFPTSRRWTFSVLFLIEKSDKSNGGCVLGRMVRSLRIYCETNDEDSGEVLSCLKALDGEFVG